MTPRQQLARDVRERAQALSKFAEWEAAHAARVSSVTPEDLLLMKIISDRPRDLADAEALARRRRQTLERHAPHPDVRPARPVPLKAPAAPASARR
jgi:hypothetical protein